jgi:hypothetical protein
MSPAVRWHPGLFAGDQLPNLLPGGQQLDADRLGCFAPRAVLDALEPAQVDGRRGKVGVVQEGRHLLDRLTRVPPKLRRRVPQDVEINRIIVAECSAPRAAAQRVTVKTRTLGAYAARAASRLAAFRQAAGPDQRDTRAMVTPFGARDMPRLEGSGLEPHRVAPQ